MNIRCLPLLAAILCLSSCVVYTTGPVRHDSRSVERDASERVRVNLNMGAGNLIIGGGARKLLNAISLTTWHRGSPRFGTAARAPRGNSPSASRRATPRSVTTSTNGPGVEQRGSHGPDRAFRRGERAARPGSLSLRSVDVHMGVGKLDMDLRGNPKHNYDVQVHGGIGEATVRLPAGVGVYAEGAGGIGEIKTQVCAAKAATGSTMPTKTPR